MYTRPRTNKMGKLTPKDEELVLFVVHVMERKQKQN